MSDRRAKEISLYLTTIHEAGHAVMAAYQGVSFTSVRVTGPGFGATHRGKGDALDVGKEALILIAARVAEDMALREGKVPVAVIRSIQEADRLQQRSYEGSDEKQLELLYDLMANSGFPDSFATLYRYYLRETKKIMNLPPVWKAVKQVASELSNAHAIKRSLSAKLVHQILNASGGK